MGLSRLEQTRSCHHSRSWKSNGLVLGPALFLLQKQQQKKSLSWNFLSPSSSSLPNSFSIAGGTRTAILAMSHAGPCHPGGPHVGNEMNYMQVGFQQLAHTRQQAAGECHLGLPSDVSENTEPIKKSNGLSSVSVHSGLERPAGLHRVRTKPKGDRNYVLLLY